MSVFLAATSMAAIPAVTNALVSQPTGESGHSGHGADNSTSFPAALAQAVGQSSVGAHAEHGAEGSLAAPGHSGHNLAARSIPSVVPHPGHFPLGGNGHGGGHDFQGVVLGVRAYRQQLIASNIANADTPGYKAVDIDFQEAVRIAQASTQASSVALATTAAGHIAGSVHSTIPPYPLKYQVPIQPSADGNTVDMDVERTKMAENSLMYEFSRDRVSNHFKHMMELLQNLK